MCHLPHPIPSVRALTKSHVQSVQAYNFDGVGWGRSYAETAAYHASGASGGSQRQRLPVLQSAPLLPRRWDVELALALKCRHVTLQHIKR